ncbi:hypothetical protein SMALB_7754 [Streptomyces malaysiensis]|uniref:Uncharacterized protein n=1 Tax=Streptomyces malaysiensis TaxID=92644 RepID=A0A7X5XAG4_STRMQ|nr:hypothetical protein [Streptomyces malaysiensis]
MQVGGSRPVVAHDGDLRHASVACRKSELLREVCAHGDDEIDTYLGREAPDLAVGPYRLVTQLQHLAEYGDGSAA